MGNSIHTLNLERMLILFLQRNGASSIEAIEEQLGIPHYTVRRLLNGLVERDVIKVVGTKNRHRLFGYNLEAADQADYIPALTDIITRKASKAIYILEATGNEEDMKAVRAAARLPQWVAELMEAANMASMGQDVQFRLDRIREQMQKDYLLIKNNSNMYEQILKETRFWNPKFLSEMTEDREYNYAEVNKAFTYFKEKNNG